MSDFECFIVIILAISLPAYWLLFWAIGMRFTDIADYYKHKLEKEKEKENKDE